MGRKGSEGGIIMDLYPRIKMAGVELEGAWTHDKLNTLGIDLEDDGSVGDFSNAVYDECDLGEIPSPPFSSVPEFMKFITTNYPDFVNKTCGMHVHVSTNTLADYQALMNVKFYSFLKLSLSVWGKKNNILPKSAFWTRLKGNNGQFCADRFNPDTQVLTEYKGGDRYTMLNYCYKVHGTMECRVLPMFKSKKIAAAAVNRVLWTVNKYLSLPGIHKPEVVELVGPTIKFLERA
jgi:hypothetical protein